MDQPSISRSIIMNTFKACSLISSIILLTHCGSSGRVVEKKSNGEYQPDHGPFDSKGNYIESWADSPPKRSYRRSSSKKSSSRTTRKKSTTRKQSTRPSRKSTTPSRSKTNKKSTSKYKKPTSTRKKPSTREKTPTRVTPKKIVPKTKPPIMHTVSKGDTVYGLARKFGASPTAIIKANNIKNGVIKIGQRLIIPRK